MMTILAGLVAPFFIAECKSSTHMVGLLGWWLTVTAVPERARFLNDREKHIAQARLHKGQAMQSFEHPSVKDSFKMLMDWKILV
jgi:hypothetical protein